MESDLQQFMLSRAISQADIQRMQQDKVDKAVLSIMTDEQMEKYISSYGDRLAVVSFCQQAQCSTDKEDLLQRLRQKIGMRKMKSRTKGAVCSTSSDTQTKDGGMARLGNTAAAKTFRKIEIGWLHFHCNEYHQVRTINGGGTRQAKVEKNTIGANILEMGKELFFPNGLSTKGRIEDFIFTLCDFKRNQIPIDDNVGKLYEQTKLKLLRFYICTKEAPSMSQSSSSQSSSEVDECCKDLLSGDSEGTSPQISERDILEHGHSPHSNSEQNVQFHRQPRSKRLRASSQNVTESPGVSNDLNVTPTEFENNLGRQGQHSHSNDHGNRLHDHLLTANEILDPCFEIVDVTSEDHHETPQPKLEDKCPGTIEYDLEVDEADTVLWDPEQDIEVSDFDGTIVIRLQSWENEDVTQPLSAQLRGESVEDLHLPTPSESNPPSAHLQTTNEEVQAYQDFHTTTGIQLPSNPAGDSNTPENPLRASIHRIKVVEDLLAVFMDDGIMNLTLKMNFVNEKAIDDTGVSREVYTAFWEKFLEQCEGETERVPRLRPDFCNAEWKAIGRIWVKGYLDLEVFPVRLSKAFVFACIHGIDVVDKEILIESFLNYLSSVERSAVKKALQGTIDESDEEDLLDLFTRMGSHTLPSKSNMEAAIETMAHKAILQEPKYVIDCFCTHMGAVRMKLPDKKSVLYLYESKKATGKRVVQLLETSKAVLSQREQTTFNHLQRYVKNADENKAEKFLRFCTGASVICVDKILVCFNAETGLGRRPVAHTCGATLEVPYTYSSYPEFRLEFDNILSSNYLEMDIV